MNTRKNSPHFPIKYSCCTAANNLSKGLFETVPVFTIYGHDKNTSFNYQSEHMEGIPMTSLFPQLSFEHQNPLGRPSCPKCGELCLFPERMQFASGRVRNSWRCDS